MQNWLMHHFPPQPTAEAEAWCRLGSEMPGLCPLPSLTNEIHPILAYEHWEDTPADLYDTIRPALQLATRLLTNRQLLPRWSNIFFGQRTKIPQSEALDGRQSGRRYRLHAVPQWQLTPTLLDNTADQIDALQGWIRVSWFDRYSTSEGTTQPVDGDGEPDHVCIRLSARHHDCALSGPPNWLSADERRRWWLRLHFDLAVTLTHELTHAAHHVVKYCRAETRGVKHRGTYFRGKEDYFEGENSAEMGYSWEMATFGRCPQWQPHISGYLNVLGAWEWPGDALTWIIGGVCWAVRMRYIAGMFEDGFWARVEVPGGAELLAVPLSPRIPWTNPYEMGKPPEGVLGNRNGPEADSPSPEPEYLALLDPLLALRHAPPPTMGNGSTLSAPTTSFTTQNDPSQNAALQSVLDSIAIRQTQSGTGSQQGASGGQRELDYSDGECSD